MSVRRTALAAVALLVVSPVLAACSSEEQPEVVASFYPLEFIAERVVGEHLDVGTLTAPGIEPHDLELTVRQTAALSEATVVLYEQGLQPSVDQAVEQADPEHVLDVTEVVSLRHVDESPDGPVDPHFWLDPTLMAQVAGAFADEVAEADPEHAADYRRNAAALVADLEELDTDFTQGLARCRIRTLVVSHDAFGYLGARYDLEIVPIAGLSPGAEPSPRRIAELQDIARAEGVTTIFSEELTSPEMAETLARDLGLQTAVLNPVEGLADEESTEDYLSVMRENLAAIRKANDCS